MAGCRDVCLQLGPYFNMKTINLKTIKKLKVTNYRISLRFYRQNLAFVSCLNMIDVFLDPFPGPCVVSKE